MEALNEELKYLEHFGLGFNPFPVSPDVENFFLSKSIDRIITEIVHGILARKGFMVLTGEVGLGKTTISRKIMKILDEKGVETSLVFHTSYQDLELLREINRDFGLHNDSLLFSDQMRTLNGFLLEQNRKGKNCAIIIDDAQNLYYKSLELVRMISNLETDRQKLVQILLIGQNELLTKLNSPELRQVKSRIIINEEASPLNNEELKNYLLFKINSAGSRGTTSIKDNAVKKVFKITKGNFRKINTLMDRCLYAAFFNNTREISKQIVKEAQHDLYPEKTPTLKKSLALGLLAAMVLLIAGSGAYSISSLNLSSFKKMTHLFSELRTVSEDKQIDTAGSVKSIQALISQNNLNSKIGVTPSAPVDNFLNTYGLSKYNDLFSDSLKNWRFDNVSAIIFENTGYRLIQLENVTSSIRQKFAVLSYPSVLDGKQSFFLFWRPTLLINKFYYWYRGEEIRLLEKMLAEADFYKDFLDGVVGKNLIQAVNAFQASMGLPITGFPDERTLFLLCHREGGSNS